MTNRRQTYRSKWEQRIRDYIPLSCTAKAVALTMSTYGTPDGTNIYPGHLRLACNLGISESTVKRATSALVKHGWIVKVRTGSIGGTSNSANVYRLAIPREWTSVYDLEDDDQGSPMSHGEGSPMSHGSDDYTGTDTQPWITHDRDQGSLVHEIRAHGCAPINTGLSSNDDQSALTPFGRRTADAPRPEAAPDAGPVGDAAGPHSRQHAHRLVGDVA